MTVFTPPPGPAFGLSRQVEPRILSAPFGDGYTQRAGDGLNAIPRTIDPTWNNLSADEADEIEAFFEAQRGYLKFEWTDPRETVARNWICKSWVRTTSGLYDSISATFEQVFDL